MLLKQEHTLVGKGLIANVKKTEAEGYKQQQKEKQHQWSEAKLHWLWTKWELIYLPAFIESGSSSFGQVGHWKELESSEILVQRVHREHMKPFLQEQIWYESIWQRPPVD